MVTWMQSKGQANEYYGLSSDEKPKSPPNASKFYEMDTSAVFLYDAAGNRWIKQANSSGGGGGGTSPDVDIATDQEVDETLDGILGEE